MRGLTSLAGMAVLVGIALAGAGCGSGSGAPAGSGVVFKLTSAGSESALHAFAGGMDGAQPVAGLVQGPDGALYGTSASGGLANAGTVFKIAPDGTESVLYAFAGSSDGANLQAGLTFGADGDLYGATYEGGPTNTGTVFKMTTTGTKTTLYGFAAGSDVAGPNDRLILATDGNFYGTSFAGGAHANGGVFRITPAGTETVIYSFTGGNDGWSPKSLIQGTDGNFYGVATGGGSNGVGTIFKLTPAGQLTVLHTFAGNGDGVTPTVLLQASDGNFYGTTSGLASSLTGTVVKLTPANQFTTLYTFAGGSDGSSPAGLLQASDGNLYGVTQQGGTSGLGTAFKVTLAGTHTVLYSFSGGSTGAAPMAGLVQGTDGSFYGTTQAGGATTTGAADRRRAR